jgi:hypothetical protein
LRDTPQEDRLSPVLKDFIAAGLFVLPSVSTAVGAEPPLPRAYSGISDVQETAPLSAGHPAVTAAAQSPGSGPRRTTSAAASGGAPSAASCPGDDGSAGAPRGTPQEPQLLDGYATTLHALSCKVAGVDYPVGPDQDLALKTLPADKDQLPARVVYDPKGFPGGYPKLVINADAGPLTLSGWDFSGVLVLDYDRDPVTIEECRFAPPATINISPPMVGTQPGAGDLVIQKCAFDGKAMLDAGFGQGVVAFQNAKGASPHITFLYDDFRHLPSLVFSQTNGGAFTMKWSLIDLIALYPGEHMNMQQQAIGEEGPFSSNIEWNTVVTRPDGFGGGSTFQYYNNYGRDHRGVLASADLGWNTFALRKDNPEAIEWAPGLSLLPSVTLHVPGSAQTYYKQSTGYVQGQPNQIQPCITGATRPAGYRTAGVQKVFTDGTCEMRGNAFSQSYSLHGSNYAGQYQTALKPGPGSIHDNYIDTSGVQYGKPHQCPESQFFYPGIWGTANGPEGTVAWDPPTGNIYMDTGSRVCPKYP